MYNWLVTGTSRGIGFEFVRQIIAGGDTVFATARSPDDSAELQTLHASSPPDRMHIIQLDVANEQSITAAATAVEILLEGHALDYMVNNAAISFGNDAPTSMKGQDMLKTFQTNVIGPALVYQAFLPALERSERPEGPVVVNITSGLGSLGLEFGVTATSYSISKCALSMLTYKQSKEKRNIIFFVLSPGWVKTAMGGVDAPTEVSVSVGMQYRVITTATKKESGMFKRHNGEDIPW